MGVIITAARAATPWVVPFAVPSWHDWLRSPMVLLLFAVSPVFWAAQLTPGQQQQMDRNTFGVERNREDLREAEEGRRATKELAVAAHHLAETNQSVLSSLRTFFFGFATIVGVPIMFYARLHYRQSEAIAINRAACETVIKQLGDAEERSVEALREIRDDIRAIREKMN